MIRLKVGDGFIDLKQGVTIEMMLRSPLFLNEDLYSDNSFNIVVAYSENNVRRLGDIFSEDTKLARSYDAELYNDNLALFTCKLVIDKPAVNARFRGISYAEGYLISGMGSFFFDIKQKRVGQLSLGGPRTFPFTSWDPYDGSNGIWQHLHATWDGSYDYVCLPYINEAATIVQGSSEAIQLLEGWVNRLDFGTLYNGWEGSDGSTIIPGGNDIRMRPYARPVLSIKVKYIIQEICREHGWTLDSGLVDDDGFDTLITIGNIPLRMTYPQPYNNPSGCTFMLGNLVSPEVTCTEFIVQRCRRYGWWPNVDTDKRIVKLVPLNTAGMVSKDYTRYANPAQFADLTGGARDFAFKNEYPSADSFPSAPDFKDYTIGAPVSDAEHLPAASAPYDKILVLCIKENAWYHVVYSDDLPLTDPKTSSRKWEKLADNIYDYVPGTATDTVQTSVTPMPVHWTVFRSNTSNEIFYGGFLRCNMSVMEPWGMRDVFYLGKVYEFKIGIALPAGFTYNGQMVDYLLAYGSINKSLTNGPYQYPFASPVPVLPDGTVVGNWANVFKIPLSYTDAEHNTHQVPYKSIVDYWWSRWIRINSNSLKLQVDLSLPLHELLSIQWDAEINILNLPFLLTQLIVPVPYEGKATATLQPIILDPDILQDTTYPYSGPVYLKLIWEEIADAPDETYPYPDGGWSYTLTQVKKGVARIYAYGDELGTVPVTPNNLALVGYRKVIYPLVPETPEDIEEPFMININNPVTQLSAVNPELYRYLITSSLGGSNTGQAVYVLQSSDNYKLID